MDKIKIGQIGVGHAHAGKLGVFLKSDDYEVIGLVEPDPTLRAQAKQGVYRDVPLLSQEQLLNAPGLQAVLVETRVRDSLDVAETCSNAGLHVHLDKPAGESWTQYQRILQSAAAKHLLVQMGYMYRYNPAVLMLRDFLKKGWLGTPFEVHTVMSKVVPPKKRELLAEYSGGTMFELGCHIIDLVIGVLGRPLQVTSFRQHASNVNDSLVDNMLAVLCYENALATVKSSAMEVDGFSRRHFVVCGDEGTFHIQPLDRPAVRVAFSTPHGKYNRGYQDLEMPAFTRYIADAADMAQVIRGEKDADFSYEHDAAVQETVLKASGLKL